MKKQWLVRRPAWVEIHLGRIVRNARRFQKVLGKSSLAAVVKADAYGHGIESVSGALHRAGVRWFCVSTAEEAHRLRDAVPPAQIMIMGPVDRRDVPDLARRRIIFTLFTIDFADELDRLAKRLRRQVTVHLKIDTGMNRLGVEWLQARDFALRLGHFRGVHVDGIYSHLATSMENLKFMHVQRRRFEWCLRQMRSLNLVPRIRHLANTGGVLVSRAFHYDLARVGLGLYGVTPRPARNVRLKLEEAMVVKARLISVKWVEPNEGVGYGLAGQVRKLTPVGVVQVGYADGLDWRLSQFKGAPSSGGARSSRAFAFYRGRPLPIIGRICMDQCFLDLTEVADEIETGDPILILGCDEENGNIGLWQTARKIGTIPYEVMTGFGKRLPRKYTAN